MTSSMSITQRSSPSSRMIPRVLCSYAMPMHGTPAVSAKMTEWKRVPTSMSSSPYIAFSS